MQMTKKDVIWSSILIAVPALALVLCVMPFMMYVYDYELREYVLCGMLNLPEDTIMSNLAPVALLATAYNVILGICYYRSQGLGTLKAIFVFSIACMLVTLLALLPRNLLLAVPYIIIPCIFLVQAVLSFIHMKEEEKRYDFD